MYIEDCEEIQHSNDELLTLFLSAKQVEGCSERSLKYYRTTLSKMNEKINKSVRQVETNDIRTYISNYENESNRKIRKRIWKLQNGRSTLSNMLTRGYYS